MFNTQLLSIKCIMIQQPLMMRSMWEKTYNLARTGN